MNDIQRQKAKEVVAANHLIDVKELEKLYALNCHLWSIQMIDKFNLPYRILLDYFKKYGYQYMKGGQAAVKDGIVLLNRCYPKPGYYMPDLIGVSMYIKKDVLNPLVIVRSGAFADDLTSTNYDLRIDIAEGSELKAEIEAKAAAQHTWNLSTHEWEYEFAHFINAADFDCYTNFDWWGNKAAPNEEQENRMNYWKSLQADYHMNPNKYRREEPTCPPTMP